ncbi:sugar ABC transporter ATP-binding protein [Labrys monachus]|uniref:Ribose transport system ATP-binding protein n=1 Tax=Labrys monachus TaxID=217067 RepID=A0ABU0FLT6_9HYPH|nr:sugar ABC transporter ATP-binding protein [Labrys monachus]MDQ0395555.1 ribose transport system ATP-binding protein [Labrys monachus]
MTVHGGETVRQETTPVLEMRNISKTFPGLKALNGVSLAAWPGEIHALMGENGAGKSTLMKILSGAYVADPGGEIVLRGRPVTIAGPLHARELGIAVIYQELSLAPNLTVAENIFLGREARTAGLADRAAMAAGSREVLARLGAGFGPKALVGSLSLAERQLVEIARAIHTKAEILVMDEPTTALSSRETDRLFDLIRRLRDDGLAIIYISHRMAEIYELSDRCSVLRDGSYVGTLSRDELSAERLVRMMVGRDISGFYKKDHAASGGRGPAVLEVEGITDGRRVKPCTLALHAGEVLGIAGLVGSGRTELARLIFGADRRAAGTIRIGGRAVAIAGPQDAIRAGLVYLTEDRKAQGLLLDMSVLDNVNLIVCSRDAGPAGILDSVRAKARAKAAISALSVRVGHERVAVGSLSGGNQQKVLLARLLEAKPSVLILDEPTRGVDIGAKSEIYRIIDQLAKAGIGIIVISSELPEIMGIADRVLVMREGAIEGEVGGDSGLPITQEAIMNFAAGLHAGPAPVQA